MSTKTKSLKKTLKIGDEVIYCGEVKWMSKLVGEVIDCSKNVFMVMWYKEDEYSHFGRYSKNEICLRD